MIVAFYKVSKSIEEQLDHSLSQLGYKVAKFYSFNSLLDQIMNPMIVITPYIFMKELKSIPVPIIPISIHLMDIEKTISEFMLEDKASTFSIIASKEELEWLNKEYNEGNYQGRTLNFLNVDLFDSTKKDPNHVYLAPVWLEGAIRNLLNYSIYFIKPSLSSQLPVLQMANTFIQFTDEMIRQRYEEEAIVHSAHNGVIAINKEGKITVVNEHARKILGIQVEMKGKKITELIPHSDMIRVLQTGKIELGDIATINKTSVVINRFPVIVNDRIVGAVSNFRELTDIQNMELKLRKKLHQKGLEAKYTLSDIVGNSSEIQQTKELSSHFAKTGATVLITGESGTGKEMFAQGIHLASERAAGPFVDVNCAALPESLLESELFGYEEGAFTGARKGGKVGLFELAHGGTLFLDEIGEMPIHIQSLLLRVLQERAVRRVGGERLIPVDVRIIAATNRNLEEGIKEKTFRSDLYYRINVLNLELPPLRDRKEDIPCLVHSIVEIFNEEREVKIKHIDDELFPMLTDYEWPGNIRELKNIIELMVVLEKGLTLSASNKEIVLKKLKKKTYMAEVEEEQGIREMEKKLISKAIEKYRDNKTLAAKSLGIDRSTLWRKMKEYKLDY